MLGELSMLQNMLFLAIALFFVTYLVVPRFARFMKSRGIYGVDVHKLRKPKVAECGGIVLMVSLLAFLSLAYLMIGDPRIMYVAAVAVLFSAYGLIDDIKRLGKYQKFGLSLSIAVVGTFLSGLTGVYFVLGVLFLVAGSNIFNLFAGLNGVEVGTSAIIAFFFVIASLMLSFAVPFYMSVGMFFILTAFLMYNKYPAKVFPGDVGTLLIGGFFASMTLYYGMYIILVPLLTMHIVDSLLKWYSAGYFSSHEKRPTKIMRNGILKPRDDFLSMIRMLLRIKPMTEKQTVNTLWLFEALIGIATISTLVII